MGLSYYINLAHSEAKIPTVVKPETSALPLYHGRLHSRPGLNPIKVRIMILRLPKVYLRLKINTLKYFKNLRCEKYEVGVSTAKVFVV